MKVLYRQTASDDIVRQFRYHLLTAEAPEIALRAEALATDLANAAKTGYGFIPNASGKYRSSYY